MRQLRVRIDEPFGRKSLQTVRLVGYRLVDDETAGVMRAPSLRTRAAVLGTLAFALLLGVGAVLLVATLESRLTDSSDQVDRARVRELLQLAESSDLPGTLRNVHDNAMTQVVGPAGEVLASSANLAGHGPVAELRATTTPAVATFEAPDDTEVETYRVWYAAGRHRRRDRHGLRRQQHGRPSTRRPLPCAARCGSASRSRSRCSGW